MLHKTSSYALLAICLLANTPTQAALVPGTETSVHSEKNSKNVDTKSKKTDLQATTYKLKKQKSELKAQLRKAFKLQKTRPSGMFPNSLGWTGLVMLIIGLLIMMIFGGSGVAGVIGTVGSIIAVVGLIFVIVWIIQRLAVYS
jgi:hypothetical protein